MTNFNLPIQTILAAINASHDGIVITDALLPDNPIVYANAAFYDLTGYTADDVIGNNCRFLQGAETNRNDVDDLKSAISEHRDFRIRLVNYTKQGRLFYNELSITPVFDHSGTVTNFIGIQHDTTAQVDQEHKIAEALAQNTKLNELLMQHENSRHEN